MDDIDEDLKSWVHMWDVYRQERAAAGRPVVDTHDPQTIAEFREWLRHGIDGKASE